MSALSDREMEVLERRKQFFTTCDTLKSRLNARSVADEVLGSLYDPKHGPEHPAVPLMVSGIAWIFNQAGQRISGVKRPGRYPRAKKGDRP